MTLNTRDRQIIWHPFTQEKKASLPIAIKSARGSYVYDEDGKSYIDLISSWWVNLHGHAHPEIAKSIYIQAQELEHVIFSGFTHEPAVKLCEMLKMLLPQAFSRFFFSDNGSTSVEVALKMAYQYWYNKNHKERSLYLSFDGAYHGDTFGSMSVGAKPGFHRVFQDLFFKVLTIPYPSTWSNDQDIALKEQNALLVLDEILEKNGSMIAAIILEPLVQGASGMRMCRPNFIRAVMDKVRKYGVLVIFDEVMTGFGRTGTNFALDQVGIVPNLKSKSYNHTNESYDNTLNSMELNSKYVPDFLCLSKGITGGFLPLALTITTETIYEAFLDDDDSYAFLHGHSYTANPIACAAAITSLNLLLKKDTQNSISDISNTHMKCMMDLIKNSDNIQNTRMLGTISAFEIKNTSCTIQEIRDMFLDSGLLLRPLGNTVYLLPP